MQCTRAMTTKRAGMLTALLAIALWVLGCGPTRPAVSSSPTLPPPTKQSPEQATLAWFSAVDHKDKAEAVADFEPSAADQTNWGNGNTSTWPTFSAIHCKPLQQKANTASVYCILAAAFLPSHQRPPSASFPPRAGCLALSQAPRARRSQGLTRLTVRGNWESSSPGRPGLPVYRPPARSRPPPRPLRSRGAGQPRRCYGPASTRTRPPASITCGRAGMTRPRHSSPASTPT